VYTVVHLADYWLPAAKCMQCIQCMHRMYGWPGSMKCTSPLLSAAVFHYCTGLWAEEA
jgi:hypothetical protein